MTERRRDSDSPLVPAATPGGQGREAGCGWRQTAEDGVGISPEKAAAASDAECEPAGMALLAQQLATMDRRLQDIQATLSTLVEQRTVKDWYGTEEVAKILGKAEFTVREWCRLGRLNAEKRMSGRGAHPAWVVSHAELQRYQREGLLRKGA
jgi:hypothetical protein